MPAVRPAQAFAASALLAELTELLAGLCGDAPQPDARLEADLRLDSLDFAWLADQLECRYGADLARYAASLSVAELLSCTVGDLADFVVSQSPR